MERAYEDELKDIMAGLVCHKGFQCYKSGFEDLCKAKDIGLESCLVCREEYPPKCHFSWDVDSAFYCTCPARVYIAKKFKV